MKVRTLIIDLSKCIGCRYCEMICTFRHKGVYGRIGSRIRIVTDDKEIINNAFVCRHCKKPVCVELCPVDAISRDEEKQMVVVDADKCIGCGLCVECPMGGMSMDTDTGLAVNCDLCEGKPACVEWCPTGALKYVLADDARAVMSAASGL